MHGSSFCSSWIAQVWTCALPSLFRVHSSCPFTFVVFWSYGSAAPPLMGHTGRASTAHSWCLQPRLPRSQILYWNQWFTQTTSHVFKIWISKYELQINILESKSRKVIACVPYLIFYHLCLVCPVCVLGQKTATRMAMAMKPQQNKQNTKTSKQTPDKTENICPIDCTLFPELQDIISCYYISVQLCIFTYFFLGGASVQLSAWSFIRTIRDPSTVGLGIGESFWNHTAKSICT